MKISEQLFEDILSGKLKGTFVLKNKQIVKSNTLKRSSIDNFPYEILINYGNGVTDYGIYKSNGDFESYSTSYFDIIDFIPYTNMKENELTIEIPEGKIVDWDESKKQNKIVLKDKQLTYEDVCKKLFKKEGYYFIYGDGCIGQGKNFDEDSVLVCPNSATTAHQLECILAKNKLANVANYLNDGWKPISGTSVWIIEYDRYLGYHATSIQEGSRAFNCGSVIFTSKELAEKAIEILGEETVKLALEPLGI